MSSEQKLPNFLICGGQRCGTTTLRSIMQLHKEIFFPPSTLETDPVALKFFSDDREYARGLEYYSQNFSSASDQHTVLCEKSVSYGESPKAIQRIATDLDGVGLIFILRNPVDRAFSHFRYSSQHCLESQELMRALILEPYRTKRTPHNLQLAKPWSYVWKGQYARFLKEAFHYFDAEQIHVIFTEELLADPWSVCNDLWNFLGVKPIDVDTVPQVNSFADRAEMDNTDIPAGLRLAVKEYLEWQFRPWNEELLRILDSEQGRRELPESWRY